MDESSITIRVGAPGGGAGQFTRGWLPAIRRAPGEKASAMPKIEVLDVGGSQGTDAIAAASTPPRTLSGRQSSAPEKPA